jgi:hypothetical protein
VGPLIVPGAALEVRVRREGLVGRIDALTDRPIEVKTAPYAVEAESLVTERPDQVEQLGMYCALLERPTGRLVTLVVAGDSVEDARTCDITFRDLPGLLSDMRNRATALRDSLRDGRPDGLARCRWFGRGCEYLSEPTCDCTGDEPEPSSAILERVERVVARPDLDAELLTRLRAAWPTARKPSIARFRDLIYPRRAYFELSHPLPPRAVAFPREKEAGPDAYRTLLDAIESGPVGEVARLLSLADEPEEEVGAFRGEPFLARTSRGRPPRTAEELVSRAPQYVLELGFRCAATGRRSGRAVVAYERAEPPGPRIRVFDLAFSPTSVFARLWRHRERALREALRDGKPQGLPACPDWMFAECPYRSECACDSPPGRSQR